MKYLYTLLFSLSIILINPWGTSRGLIWTQPKIFVLLLLCLLNLSILWKERSRLTIPNNWKIGKLLWELFLGIGLLSTILSPFPLRSFWGQDEMGDGWLYWLVIAVFTLSNTLLLRHHPELLRPQFNGLLVGGVILAISIFPQAIDWRIDYTATIGQTFKANVLTSTVFQAHQPIGFYSHRGHAAIVLAVTALLALVGWLWQWISNRYFTMNLALIIPALLMTQTRAGILALLVAAAYLLGQKYYKLLVPAVLVCLLLITIMTSTRQIAGLSVIKQVTSDRIYLWQLSVQGISQRPLLGWGFDGFGIAYPFVRDPKFSPTIVGLGDNSFSYLGKNKQPQVKPLISNKAHNSILDTTLSVGVLGLLSYSTLLGFYLWRVIKSPLRGIVAIALAYFIFSLTWFECAQFSHLVWWALSLWGVTASGSFNPPHNLHLLTSTQTTKLS